MSRIERPRVEDGDSIDATTINDTYDDYSQTDLNRFNVRDQAFDLPHFNTDVEMIVNVQPPILLGTGGKAHPGASSMSVAARIATPAVSEIVDSLLQPTFMDWNANPWVIEPGDCLRIWWNLSMYTPDSSAAWNAVGAFGKYNVGDGTGGTTVLSDGFHCWIAYLQWDITSAALGNWEPVPGQMNPQVGLGSSPYDGMYAYLMNGATVISPWTLSGGGGGQDSITPTTGINRIHGWFAPYGMFVHAPSQQVTVYGVRLVLSGVYHIGHFTAATEPNVFLLDYAVGADMPDLEYTSGRMSAVHMRMG